ncbi:hypothetical protein IQ249_13595 [Lusitaniella coriacea LEGE 07157]|uniref:Uncharacterized protein n=1 Tax=Lusitaniella coriacea LEGE 07157 TaxID=945747 RepID=A0A8J7E028_9CYAN|nr:hypothetical protein [Lusitaniella coriacea]MBE9116936.1 hypothetical protein [Lusitaniella coriacea LEGE 07157]
MFALCAIASLTLKLVVETQHLPKKLLPNPTVLLLHQKIPTLNPRLYREGKNSPNGIATAMV